MSPREKTLLLFFASAAFLLLNFLGFRLFADHRTSLQNKRSAALVELETAERFRASSEDILDEMDWLAEHEPEPQPFQDVQNALQQLAESEATAAGLTIKTQKLLPTDTTSGVHYHRAKVQISVTGSEEALYRWFDRINVPQQFRSATLLRISPNREDDTRIDCTADIEQWFVPLPSA